MASALAAFAYGLGAKDTETHKAKEADAQVVESEDDDDTHQEPQASRTMSLVDIAQVNNSKPTQPAKSLADFALQQNKESHRPAALSLLQVAQQENQEAQQLKNRQQLASIAAQLSHEDAQVAKQRSEKIQSALQVTSAEVRAQMQAKQRQAIEQAVQQAIVEEQQYRQDDEFEQEDEDDPAIQQAAHSLIAKVSSAAATSQNMTKKLINSEKDPIKLSGAALSVDRHVLKQRQNQHGLLSKSTSRAKTMKDKLSSFQFHQPLSITQRRLFLATLVGDDAGDNNVAMKNGKKSKYNKVRLVL